MKFRFKLVAVLIIALLVIGIYNLGTRNNEEAEEEEKQSYYQTETVYLWYSDETFTDYFTSAAVAFHEKNPDVRVIPQLVAPDEYIEYINSASVSGENFPDLYVLTNDALEKAYLAGLASETDKTGTVNKAHFSQSSIDSVTYHDKIIGYPLYFETSVLVYNKTYLKDWLETVKENGREEEEALTKEEIEAEGGVIDDNGTPGEAEYERFDYESLTLEDLIPHTIEDIKKFADDYDAPDGVDGVFKWDVSDVFYNYFFAGNYMIVGGEAGDDEGNIDIYNENTIRCMNVYQNLNQFFSIDADTSSYESMLENFFDGKFVFTIATSDVIAKADAEYKAALAQHEQDVANLDKKLEELQKRYDSKDLKEEDYKAKVEEAQKSVTPVYEFGFARIPELSEELQSRSLSVTNALVVNGYSEHKKAANRVASFITTDYSDHLYAKTGMLAASYDAGYEDETFKLFQEEYANSIPLPKLAEASNFWVQLEITFTKIWTGENTDELLRSLSEQIKTQITGEEVKETPIKIKVEK